MGIICQVRNTSARFRETMEKLRQMMKRMHNSEKLLIFLLFV
jgi:hypothetical protein